MNSAGKRIAEAVALALGGGVLAGATGSIISLTIPAAAVGAVNGAFTGWRHVYDWKRLPGPVAFVLDSTWGLPMTAAGLFANVVGAVSPNAGYVPELSERHNRQVYRRGFTPRAGKAITLGNVISGAAEVERPRRAKLVTDHEDVHVWQARWWGPAFPVLYVGWTLIGGAVGAVLWVNGRRKHGEKLFTTMEVAGYYLNPFEWWGYSRDDYWPPRGVDFGWKDKCCRPLTVAKPARPSGRDQIHSKYR